MLSFCICIFLMWHYNFLSMYTYVHTYILFVYVCIFYLCMIFPILSFLLFSLLLFLGTKRILHEVNGYLPQGQLIAIMGPSGAGKSTLLNVLSGYSIKGVGGNVYVNGFPRDLKAFRKLSCYITQDDRLQPLLTVEENMNVAADLKLGMEVSRAKKEAIVSVVCFRKSDVSKSRQHVSVSANKLGKEAMDVSKIYTRFIPSHF